MKNKIFSEDEYNQAYRYCISLSGDPDEAFDLLQASFEKLLKRGVEDLESPKLYLYRIIRNQFIDLRRKDKTWRFNEFHEETNIIHLNSDRFDDILATKDEVETLMKSMSPEERELIYLSAVEGYSVTEMSELSGTPRGTLLSKLHRLKLRLKKQFPNKTAEQTG